MKRFIFAIVVMAACLECPADEGMWLINRPPVKALKERYGFEPSAKWLEHVQKSAARFSGSSSAFVSRDGLLLTNHHVGVDSIEKLSTPERDLLAKGFLARTREEELKCPEDEVKVLMSIEDVTERVLAATKPGMNSRETNTAIRQAILAIERESESQSGLDSQVVTLYQGARYHLYRYKRYTDVRLVFAPEKAIAFFGGDTDNFEYPRFDLDVCLFRVYEDGKPLKSEHFLKVNPAGAAEGDLAFVAGHPGRTRRLNTVDHLRYLRDHDLPRLLQAFWRREVQLQTFTARSQENALMASTDLFGAANGRKARTGAMAALLNPDLIGKKIAEEKKLRDAVAANAEWREQWGDAWDAIASAKRVHASFALRHDVMRRLWTRTALPQIAMHLVRLAEEKQKPNEQRLREYGEADMENLRTELFSPAPVYDALEIDRLSSALSHAAELLGAEDPFVIGILGGKSPRERAEQLIGGTKLKDIEMRKRMAEMPPEALPREGDSLIDFMKAVDPQERALRTRYEDEVEAVERESYAKIAAAQFAVKGDDAYPDATSTLRLSFGTIRGYEEGGKRVPALTTHAGLYERWEARRNLPQFELPRSWIEARERLSRTTPMNFVLTADIIGGNSGSPVINRQGELVGVIFDGNIQSLSWDYAYDDRQARALAVDIRSVIESMRIVYGAEHLLNEMLGDH